MPDGQNTPFPSTQDIAQRGEAIYRQKYQEELEKSCNGKFVAVNVNTGEITVGDTSTEAVRSALEKDPSGLFHLMRVGYQAALAAGWYITCAS
jgi:hypothetical protein